MFYVLALRRAAFAYLRDGILDRDPESRKAYDALLRTRRKILHMPSR